MAWGWILNEFGGEMFHQSGFVFKCKKERMKRILSEKHRVVTRLLYIQCLHVSHTAARVQNEPIIFLLQVKYAFASASFTVTNYHFKCKIEHRVWCRHSSRIMSIRSLISERWNIHTDVHSKRSLTGMTVLQYFMWLAPKSSSDSCLLPCINMHSSPHYCEKQ